MSAIFLFFLALTTFSNVQQAAAVVTPLFTCWFPTFENQIHSSTLIFGYENTGTTTVKLVRENNTAVSKVLEKRPPFFAPGLHERNFSVDIIDLSVLPITWTLTTQGTARSVSVTEADLNEANLCITKYNGRCDAFVARRWPHFCEDGSYCNGGEMCDASLGRCVASRSSPRCRDGSQMCNERILCAVDECGGHCLFTEECNAGTGQCEPIPCSVDTTGASCDLIDETGCYGAPTCSDPSLGDPVCVPGAYVQCNPVGGSCFLAPSCATLAPVTPVANHTMLILLSVLILILICCIALCVRSAHRNRGF